MWNINIRLRAIWIECMLCSHPEFLLHAAAVRSPLNSTMPPLSSLLSPPDTHSLPPPIREWIANPALSRPQCGFGWQATFTDCSSVKKAHSTAYILSPLFRMSDPNPVFPDSCPSLGKAIDLNPSLCLQDSKCLWLTRLYPNDFSLSASAVG